MMESRNGARSAFNFEDKVWYCDSTCALEIHSTTTYFSLSITYLPDGTGFRRSRRTLAPFFCAQSAAAQPQPPCLVFSPSAKSQPESGLIKSERRRILSPVSVGVSTRSSEPCLRSLLLASSPTLTTMKPSFLRHDDRAAKAGRPACRLPNAAPFSAL